ncbi:MAG: hypothetical protein HKN25_02750 [Pyrinomonadaceae bacterium]|nr:hypothetical protein [Pyrinomonadaceae bacterium]
MKVKLILLTAFLSIGCTSLLPKNEHGYPYRVVENIISGCEKTAAIKEVCPCMAEKLQKKYSFDEFVKIEKSITNGKTPRDFQKFATRSARQCAVNVKR